VERKRPEDFLEVLSEWLVALLVAVVVLTMALR
jgi:hypothetical protein